MQVQSVSATRTLETNKLIRNTYSLLAMTLVFSALMAGLSMAINPPPMVALICSFAGLGILWFLLPRTANSSAGIVTVFAFTGLMGFGLGPMLNAYLQLPNGGQTIMLAMGGTGAIFFGLSAYALSTRKDFSFMGGFLAVGFLVVIVAAIANLFLGISGLSLAISAVVMLLMSGWILYDTSQMVHGHVDNYIVMTSSLFINILNIFTSLLHLLGFAGGDD